MHFNCITSFRGKIYKQKELLKYNINEGDYYSSTINKYLKIHYINNSSNIDYDKKIVMLSFFLAIKTSRILILPKFNCRNSLVMKKFTNKNCSYDELFDINVLDIYLHKNYRENVLFI